MSSLTNQDRAQFRLLVGQRRCRTVRFETRGLSGEGRELCGVCTEVSRRGESEMSSGGADISCGHVYRAVTHRWRDEMPSFFIRLLNVFGCNPRMAAAPFPPPTTPPVVRNTEMMCDRSTSCSLSMSRHISAVMQLVGFPRGPTSNTLPRADTAMSLRHFVPTRKYRLGRHLSIAGY